MTTDAQARLSPRDAQQIDATVAALRDVLGDDLAGAYLHGSAVLGGLRPGSDLDVLAVARRRMTTVEKRALIDRLMTLSGRKARPPGRSLEVTVVVASDVRPSREPLRFDFQYGDWLRDRFEAGEVEPWPEINPDVAVLVAATLLADRPLSGPPPSELLDAPSQVQLRASMLAGLDDLLADLPTDTTNVLLTLARIWTTIATGEIRPKDAAADWAIERLPGGEGSVLGRARDDHRSGAPADWQDADAVHRTAEVLVGRIRGASARCRGGPGRLPPRARPRRRERHR